MGQADMTTADWPEKLNAYIDSMRAVPFEWGKNDCVTFSAGWVKEKTGVDVLSDLHWTGMRDALRLLQAEPLRARIDKLFTRRASIYYAQRGDLVLARNEDHEEYVAVCTGANIVAPRREGLSFVPIMLSSMIAWEVK